MHALQCVSAIALEAQCRALSSLGAACSTVARSFLVTHTGSSQVQSQAHHSCHGVQGGAGPGCNSSRRGFCSTSGSSSSPSTSDSGSNRIRPSTSAGCSSAGGSSPPSISSLDQIHLKGMRFYGYHGVMSQETQLGQPFEVDATLFCDLSQAGRSDRLEHTADYSVAYKVMRDVMEGPPLHLLEAAADRMCKQVLASQSIVAAVRVHVKKLSVPGVPAVVSSVGIDILRERRHYGL